MPWSEISLTVPNSLKDAVSGELSELGAAGLWESAEPAPEHTRLVAYFEQPPNLDTIRVAMQPLFQRAGLDPPPLDLSSIKDQDWGEEWKKSWRSFPMGERFFVIPSWEDSVCPPEREPIRIDPGQAFGTGTHETTQLTLEAMERWMPSGRVVLDLGTGSGILAIAAVRLGARHVFACDVDPIAVGVASENLERNVAGSVDLMCSSLDAFADNAVDFLLCNLTADVITAVFPEIQRVMRPKAIAVFSGILQTQIRSIRQTADRFGHTLLEETSRGEWCALVTQKNGR